MGSELSATPYRMSVVTRIGMEHDEVSASLRQYVQLWTAYLQDAIHFTIRGTMPSPGKCRVMLLGP